MLLKTVTATNMGLFNKKKKADEKAKKEAPKAAVKKAEKKADKKPAAKKVAPKTNTGSAYQVLLRPIVTEKSTRLAKESKYVFEVAMNANKIEIKKAVKNVYGVDPTDVTVLRVLGKPKRTRFGRGRTKHWRKAVVTLKKGQSIEVFATKA